MTTTPSNGTYNAHEHLVQIQTKQGLRDYLPAAWRLYELNLRYPDANFTSEIVFLDADRDLVAVKCRLFLGPDFDLASKKTEALKSGSLANLDKVETAAKARCARDFGISTELALDIHEAETTSIADELSAIMAECKALGLASDLETWATYKKSILGRAIPNAKLSVAQLGKLREAIASYKQQDDVA